MRCAACRGHHDTVAQVRACHTGPAAAAPPAATVDPFDLALSVLAAAGLAGEVIFDNRRARRGLLGAMRPREE